MSGDHIPGYRFPTDKEVEEALEDLAINCREKNHCDGASDYDWCRGHILDSISELLRIFDLKPEEIDHWRDEETGGI